MNMQQIDAIGMKYQNNSIRVISRFEEEMSILSETHYPLLNNTIEDLIKQKKILAGCNRSVKNRVMGAYQVILAPNKMILIEKEIYSKKWNLNAVRLAKIVILLDLIRI